jgi:hypothetical protein
MLQLDRNVNDRLLHIRPRISFHIEDVHRAENTLLSTGRLTDTSALMNRHIDVPEEKSTNQMTIIYSSNMFFEHKFHSWSTAFRV